jgi:hypothetical protein
LDISLTIVYSYQDIILNADSSNRYETFQNILVYIFAVYWGRQIYIFETVLIKVSCRSVSEGYINSAKDSHSRLHCHNHSLAKSTAFHSGRSATSSWIYQMTVRIFEQGDFHLLFIRQYCHWIRCVFNVMDL